MKFNNYALWFFLAVGSLSFTGCATTGPSIGDLESAQRNLPRRAATSFTPALTCMDQLLKQSGAQTLYFTAAPIYDRSEALGSAGTGANEMLIGAMLEMSKISDAIRFVSFDNTIPNITSLQGVHPNNNKFRHPDFFVRGAITQIEKGIQSNQHGLSVGVSDDLIEKIAGSGASGSLSNRMKSITLDMYVGMVPTLQMLPGISSANTLTLSDDSVSFEIDLTYEGNGLVYSLDRGRTPSLSDALRDLVEIGTIEMVGKLYGVPFWQCLSVAAPSADEEEEVLAEYKGMNDEELYDFMKDHFVKSGYIKADEKLINNSVPYKNLLGRYRFENNLNPYPTVDYNLFRIAFLKEKVLFKGEAQ